MLLIGYNVFGYVFQLKLETFTIGYQNNASAIKNASKINQMFLSSISVWKKNLMYVDAFLKMVLTGSVCFLRSFTIKYCEHILYSFCEHFF